MRKLIISFTAAALVVFALVATVAAADPTPTPSRDQVRDRETIPTLLGLTHAEVMDLRHDGFSLAQIAEQQKVAVQKIIDALVARWTERISVRVANGALTETEAADLKARVVERATEMVNRTEMGGMRGSAVGAGSGNGAGPAAGSGAAVGNGPADGSGQGGPAGNGRGPGSGGAGNGSGTCDGSGPHGGRP